MKEIRSAYTCFAAADQECSQFKGREQLCAQNLDGACTGCVVAEGWIKSQIAEENMGISGVVKWFVSDDNRTLRAELRDKFINKAYIVTGGIVRTENLSDREEQ